MQQPLLVDCARSRSSSCTTRKCQFEYLGVHVKKAAYTTACTMEATWESSLAAKKQLPDTTEDPAPSSLGLEWSRDTFSFHVFASLLD